MAFFGTAVTGQINDAIGTDLNALYPEHRRQALAALGDQWASYYELLTGMGQTVSVSQETYTHWEDLFWISSQTIKTGTAAGAADATVNIIFQEDVNSRTYAREGDTIILPGDIRAILGVKIGVDTFPATPTVLGTNIPILSTGDVVSVEANAFGEGTDQPEGRFNSWLEDGGEVQIFKETIDITGTAKTDQTWFGGSEESGAGEGRTLWHLNQPTAEYRIKIQMQNAFSTQEPFTNPAAQADASGNVIRSTEGFIPYIKRRGNVLTIAAGAVTLADFNAIELYSASQRAAGVQLVMSGLTRGQEYNTLFKTEFADSNIPQVQKAMEENMQHGQYVVYRELSLSAIINYKMLKMTTNAYCFSEYDIWSSPEMYNTTPLAAIYQNYSAFLPFGSHRDPYIGTEYPYFGYAYKNFGGYNRKLEIWDFGSAKPVNRIGGIDSDNLFLRAHQGSWYNCGNRMQLIQA